MHFSNEKLLCKFEEFHFIQTWNSHAIYYYELDDVDWKHYEDTCEICELTISEESEQHKYEVETSNGWVVHVSLDDKSNS